MERQMEDQHQKLHITEINLATEKQTILNLKAELQKAKEVARVAREAAEATMNVWQGLCHGIMGSCHGLGRSPCRLRVEEAREYLLPKRYSKDYEHGPSY